MKALFILALLTATSAYANQGGAVSETCTTTKHDTIVMDARTNKNVTTVICISKSYTKEELIDANKKATDEMTKKKTSSVKTQVPNPV